MIKNDREYKITQSHVAKFKKTLEFLAKSRVKSRFDNVTIDLQEAATKSMIDDLESQLREYDELKAGHYETDLDLVDAIAAHLIKARIALNWTQKDLAKQIGTSEQQIQRYEATDYQSASLATLKRIGDVLRGHLKEIT